MMLRLMIVDDEIWVCALLRQIIDWKSIGYELVAEAHEGREALRLIEQHQPDVVITDIRIPGLDGIEMMGEARQRGIQTEFIVVSGYGDFDYAKKAIQMGVLDYILKPVEKAHLEKLMIKTRDLIVKKQSEESRTRQMRQQLDRSVNMLRDMFLIHVLQNHTMEYEEKALSQINEEFALHFQEGALRAAVFKFEAGAGGLEQNLMAQLMDIVGRSVKARLHTICHQTCLLWLNETRLVCVVNYPESCAELVRRTIHVVFDEVRSEVAASYGLEVSGALGCAVPSLYRLVDSYTNASHALAARLLVGAGRLIEMSVVAEEDGGKERLSLNKEMKLINLFDAEDKGAFAQFVDELFGALSTKPEQAHALLALASDIIGCLYKNWQDNWPDALEGLPDEAKLRDDLDNCRSVDQLIASLLSLAEKVWVRRAQASARQSNKIVDVVKAYITKNYQNNITLGEVAAAMYMNASYLSNLFKKETGVAFTQYLTEYRMEIAKELLTDMRYRIIDVAELVGYNDVNYFSRQFKKVVGISAASYRKVHM